jgi:hypothetical protein
MQGKKVKYSELNDMTHFLSFTYSLWAWIVQSV